MTARAAAGRPLRVVIIAPVLPHDAIPHAGGVYLQHLHRTLADSGASLTFLVHDLDDNRDAAAKAGAPAEVHFLGFSGRRSWLERLAMWAAWNLESRVARWDPTWPPIPLLAQLVVSPEARHALRSADVVDVQWPEYARALPLVRLLNRRARRIATLHDVLSQRWQRRSEVVSGEEARIARRAARSARRLERAVARTADTIVVFSDKDRQLLPGAAEVEVVHPPLADQTPPTRRIDPHRPAVVFVSLLGREENHDAAMWLVTEVWPRVHASHPGARLRLVGKGAADDLVRACEGTPGVELAGFVPDLAGEYASASACVVPLRTGAGVKFKTVEALVAGVPTVTTTVGAEGVAGPETFAALTDDPVEIADALIGILRAPADAEAAARAAQAWAAERYSLAAFTPAVRRIYGLDGLL